MSTANGQLLMAALRAAAHIAGTKAEVEHGKSKLRALELQLSHQEKALQAQLSHDKDMFEMKAGLLRDLIKALIEQRVDAVRQGFKETLAMYAEQSRHYMAQQERYADAEIMATAPLQRASLRARLTETDIHLSGIRSDAKDLYREMTKVVILIGGAMPPMSSEDMQALNI
jgi:hypothetical protein